jgi:hypothetical protein
MDADISYVQDGKQGRPPDINQSPNTQESEVTNDLTDKRNNDVADFIQKGKRGRPPDFATEMWPNQFWISSASTCYTMDDSQRQHSHPPIPTGYVSNKFENLSHRQVSVLQLSECGSTLEREGVLWTPEINFKGAYTRGSYPDHERARSMRGHETNHERTRSMRGLESNPKITRGTKDPKFRFASLAPSQDLGTWPLSLLICEEYLSLFFRSLVPSWFLNLAVIGLIDLPRHRLVSISAILYIRTEFLIIRSIPTSLPLSHFSFFPPPLFKSLAMVDIGLVVFGFVTMTCVVAIFLVEFFTMPLPSPPSNPADDIELRHLPSHVDSEIA